MTEADAKVEHLPPARRRALARLAAESDVAGALGVTIVAATASCT
jgi:hypothetical protein